MKLKKIIIRKYDKNLKVFENPIRFIYDFYSFRFLKVFKLKLDITSDFKTIIYQTLLKFSVRKSISPFSISLRKINILTDDVYCDKIETYTHTSFCCTTSILVHCFLFYTFFNKISFFITHNLIHGIDELSIRLKRLFKNFYIPFIYFIAFKSVEV